MFRVIFWGVRGSTPVPGSHTVEIGGNTSCVQIRVGSDTVILDAGTGLRPLGEHLVNEDIRAMHLFMSHVHWDHTQGLPFFRPVYNENTSLWIYGGHNPLKSIEASLREQIAEPHFPVTLDRFAAKIQFETMTPPRPIRLPSGAKVSAIHGEHPGGVLIYRLDYQEKSLVYATDVEFENGVPNTVIDFIRGADVFIFDAMYTPEEYEGTGKNQSRGSRRGWGHSTYVTGAEMAKRAQVKKYLLFHHDPNQTDEDVRQKVEKARKLFKNTEAAVEGMQVILMDEA